MEKNYNNASLTRIFNPEAIYFMLKKLNYVNLFQLFFKYQITKQKKMTNIKYLLCPKCILHFNEAIYNNCIRFFREFFSY